MPNKNDDFSEDDLLGPYFSWRSVVSSKHGPPSPMTRHVLLALSLHISELGDSFFPTIQQLAEETALPEHSVRKHLMLAEEGGWFYATSDGFVVATIPAHLCELEDEP